MYAECKDNITAKYTCLSVTSLHGTYSCEAPASDVDDVMNAMRRNAHREYLS